MHKGINGKVRGHIGAIFTVGVWGTTFISSKLLLAEFTPFQLLFSRFLLGYLFLWLICPKVLKPQGKKEEGIFALAGLLGITSYYFVENIALTYTNASNVGVVVSLAPFFTVLLAKWLTAEKQVNGYFYVGLVVALSGIAIISFGSFSELKIHPVGDFLGILAAFIWAAYSLLSRKISEFGHNLLLATRRTLFYGLLFMLPILLFSKESFPRISEWSSDAVLNILFLGIGASAICFVTWNYSVSVLGAVQASMYIYAVPAITVITSVLFLKESFTPAVALGTFLTTAGLFLSEKSSSKEIEYD
ncbi:DMT family transporter [Enterococcus sp. LJL51]|uniref:DMT family transporter n=1 Tax=Enterococcus sp. LJL51 TaxID=3416656 RepID=UPI003CF9F99E